MSGQIPDLSALVNLFRLDLDSNQLTGQVPDLSALTGLFVLNLSSNQLTGSLQDMEISNSLAHLILDHNQLTGDLQALSELINLQELNLSNNRLTGRLQVLSELIYLRKLDLSDNQLTGPVPDLRPLTRLETLDLTGNELCLPDSTDLSLLSATVSARLQDHNLPSCGAYAERQVLVALHQATDGPNWTFRDNWVSDEPLSSWYGVTMDSDGSVTEIRLSGDVLNGSIPDLGGLEKLTVLDLNTNQLTGTIPALGTLTNLTTLDLSDNQLTGMIPALDTLTNLTTLDLSDNQLTGTIPALGTLTNLTTLHLDSNGLTGPISDLSALTNLASLDLSGNDLCLTDGTDLTVLISAVATHLQNLDLPSCSAYYERAALVALYQATDGAGWSSSGNWITDEPVSTWHGVTVDNNGNVTELRLPSNMMDGSIPDLSRLKKLKVLDLNTNPLNGQIPDLSSLTDLTTLDLSLNLLDGSIPELSTLTNLTTLNLSSNDLTGEIPDMSALTSLTSLDLRGNDLCLADGTDLTTLISVVANHLSSLNLSTCTSSETTVTNSQRAALVALYNATDGSSWTQKGNWLTEEPLANWHGVFANQEGYVTQLILEKNGLKGTIPDLGGLTELTILDLNGNELSGQIPDLSALTKLTALDLSSKQLSGQLPDFSALASLGLLDLDGNRLSGPFPDLSSLTLLWWLQLSDNQFSGGIPDLSTFADLNTLILSSNQFSGEIPDLSALTELGTLDLRNNQLDGEIPDLSSLTNLWSLRLNNNQLEGRIPDLSTLSNLWGLHLSGNRLTGGIPSLSALTELDALDLSLNQLDGEIPDLGALTSLKRLVLNNNKLEGRIPDLSALKGLESLRLSSNLFEGEVPDLGALTRLKWLYLDSNQLTGQFPEVSTLTELTILNLSNNQLTGTILDLNLLVKLGRLYLNHNQFSGPFPDLSTLTELRVLDLSSNQLCQPANSDVSGSNTAVAAHLTSLNLADCTDEELSATPGTPQNLSASVADGQVILTWDAVTDAASYNLRAWDSFGRLWGPVGGVITDTTTFTHTVLTDGRNYYYQVRARDADDGRGGWSEHLYVAVVSTQFPPPAQSLGFEMYYQKYMNVGGVVVVAPSVVSDEQMIRSRGVITGMLANRSDLLAHLGSKNALIYVRDGSDGIAFGTTAYAPIDDPHCGTFIHEFAHLIDFAIDDLTGAEEFNTRLRALYKAAVTEGLWPGEYALTNVEEYWAEIVKYWLWEYMPPALAATYPTVEDYDPDFVTLLKDTLGEVTVPEGCKP